MDNTKIHKDREVAEVIRTAGLLILFLLPYSPMLNKGFSKINGHAHEDLADGLEEHKLQDLIQLRNVSFVEVLITFVEALISFVRALI